MPSQSTTRMYNSWSNPSTGWWRVTWNTFANRKSFCSFLRYWATPPLNLMNLCHQVPELESEHTHSQSGYCASMHLACYQARWRADSLNQVCWSRDIVIMNYLKRRSKIMPCLANTRKRNCEIFFISAMQQRRRRHEDLPCMWKVEEDLWHRNSLPINTQLLVIFTK